MGKKAYPLQTFHKSMMMCFPAVCPVVGLLLAA